MILLSNDEGGGVMDASKLSIQALISWRAWYIRYPKMRTVWGSNDATLRWLESQIAERRLYNGEICS